MTFLPVATGGDKKVFMQAFAIFPLPHKKSCTSRIIICMCDLQLLWSVKGQSVQSSTDPISP